MEDVERTVMHQQQFMDNKQSITAREGQQIVLEQKVEDLERIVIHQQQLMDNMLASVSQLQVLQELMSKTIQTQQEELALRPGTKLSDVQQEVARMHSRHDTIAVKLSDAESDLASQKSWGSFALSRLESHRTEIAMMHQRIAKLSSVVESLDSKVAVQAQMATEDMIAAKGQLAPRDHQIQQVAMADLGRSLDTQLKSLQAQVDNLVVNYHSRHMILMEKERANMEHQLVGTNTLKDPDALRHELKDPEVEFSGVLRRPDTGELANESSMSEVLRHIKNIASPSRAKRRILEESDESCEQRNLLEMFRLP
jgi:hypothetical protein